MENGRKDTRAPRGLRPILYYYVADAAENGRRNPGGSRGL